MLPGRNRANTGDSDADRRVIKITKTQGSVTLHYLEMIKPSRVSFGGTAGIVTSMALIAGLDAAKAGRASTVGALLIAAVADNLTDSLKRSRVSGIGTS